MLSIIVAVANNNVIGKENRLLWHIPEDLRRFKSLTTGKTIIMGRKTFQSLGRVLPNRKHIVLCKTGMIENNDGNVIAIKNIEGLDEYINSEDEVFVIGGGMIYKLLLPYTKKMYITRIDEDFEGDTFFPEIDYNEWDKVSEEQGLKNDENPYDYKYITYIRHRD